MKLGARGKDISDRELKCVFTLGSFVVEGVRPKSGASSAVFCDGAASSSRRTGPREAPVALGRVDEAEDASLSGQITSASQAAVQRINIHFVFAVASSFTLVPQF
jgi:hypothetical protein